LIQNVAAAPITQGMTADAAADNDDARRPAGLRTLLLAQLPPLIMVLVANVVAIFISVKFIGVWPTVAIWCVLLALVGTTLIKFLRLRRPS
jgi:hypothetical protein